MRDRIKARQERKRSGGGHREDSEGLTITTVKTYLRGYGRRIIGADVVTHSACDSGKEQPRCRENGNESRREDRDEREREHRVTQSQHSILILPMVTKRQLALRWITVAPLPLLISLPEQGRMEMPRPLCNAQGKAVHLWTQCRVDWTHFSPDKFDYGRRRTK